jgi:alpha-tubulin suppressor-like RCC1 family protein
MVRNDIRRWVASSLSFGLLTSCFVPKYSEFESDAGSPGNSNSGGTTSVGGTSSTAPGGTSASGGAGGIAGGGGKTSVGGTNAAGGSINVGGTNATGGAGTSPTGGTGPTGGAITTGGISTVGGTSSAGNTGNTGGKVNIGGSTSTGGVSSSPAGGTAASTGGTAASTGGTAASTGGTTVPTGGTAPVTGGAPSSGGANPTGGSSTTGGVTGTGGTTSPPKPIQISAGYEHSCALLSDNSVWCWGRNSFGELGISNTTNRSTIPVKVQFAAGTSASVKAIAAGTYHSCAVFSDETAQCWGDNEFGELGDGTTTSTSVPVTVMASATTPQLRLSGIQSISTGGKFTCAVVSDSTSTSGNIAKCWGYGSSGQLGTGCSGCKASYPSTVVTNTTTNTLLRGVSSVSAGSSHACAVLTGGATYCWGSNVNGRLGNGSTTDSNLPQQVYDGASTMVATDVSAGGFSTCALVNSSVRCWGYNYYGQLGSGSNNLQETNSVSVTLPDNSNNSVIQISTGDKHACAVAQSGDIYCWGQGASGQLGRDPSLLSPGCNNGDGNYCSSTPMLSNFSNIKRPNVKVSCGNQFMMAWDDSGSAYGLGYDYYGQLGDGYTTYTNYIPVPLTASWLK